MWIKGFEICKLVWVYLLPDWLRLSFDFSLFKKWHNSCVSLEQLHISGKTFFFFFIKCLDKLFKQIFIIKTDKQCKHKHKYLNSLKIGFKIINLNPLNYIFCFCLLWLYTIWGATNDVILRKLKDDLNYVDL